MFPIIKGTKGNVTKGVKKHGLKKEIFQNNTDRLEVNALQRMVTSK